MNILVGVLVFLLVLLTTALVIVVANNKKYGCVQGTCKESPHGDFTSMAACTNNCKPPVIIPNCMANPNLKSDINSFSEELCPMFSDKQCPTQVRPNLLGPGNSFCNLHHQV